MRGLVRWLWSWFDGSSSGSANRSAGVVSDPRVTSAPDVTDFLEEDGPAAPVVRDLKLDMPRWVYELDDDETVQVPREVVLRDGG